MQFLWMHVKDLVGKGIAIGVLSEFFIYAVFTMVPLALPLAILLASLMTFGNLGESFELTAMKAAGISLFRIMRPLIIFICFVCVGAFYFSNYVFPAAQTKLWALIFSLRQKSPELDIPVGEFYSGIDGLNVYVRGRDGKLLRDLMIYDFSSGFNNATVTVADSGYVKLTADNKYLLLTLYSGESFENIKQQGAGTAAGNSIPYRRETFGEKEVLIDFDNELNRYDESILQDQHVSKNVRQLSFSIDSVGKVFKSRLDQQTKDLFDQDPFLRSSLAGELSADSLFQEAEIEKTQEEALLSTYNMDSLLLGMDQYYRERAAVSAVTKAKERSEQVKYNKIMLRDPIVYIRKQAIELHKKFTLSFACLIFFFIGAPLGAIIRKGGLGMPAVTSVLMFIVYYIIDNTGYKMAREGIWEVYQGMWLSSAILLPIGIFLTYKAAVDATLFSGDQYKKFWENVKVKFSRILKKRRV